MRRLANQLSAALIQVFTPLDEFLAGIDNVIGNIFSFTAKRAASARAGRRRDEQGGGCTKRGSQQ